MNTYKCITDEKANKGNSSLLFSLVFAGFEWGILQKISHFGGREGFIKAGYFTEPN